MFDPVTVATTAALAEGVKFLYGQLTEAMKAHRQRATAAVPPDGASVALSRVESGPLDGELQTPQVSSDDLERAMPLLRELRSRLAEYQDGLLPVDDAVLPELLGRTRGLLEALYRQRITFVDESGRRQATGSVLGPNEASRQLSSAISATTGSVVAKSVSGQVATSHGVAIGGSVGGNVSTGGTAHEGAREQ